MTVIKTVVIVIIFFLCLDSVLYEKLTFVEHLLFCNLICEVEYQCKLLLSSHILILFLYTHLIFYYRGHIL